MGEKFADLHIHSYYSDGTMSPKEILEMAKNNNVALMAITDHDVLEGARELLKICEGTGIKCIAGVELDAKYKDLNFHILGYGVDLENEDFKNFVKKDRALLDEVNTRLIEMMEKDYEDISLEDYNNYSYKRNKGGWKALHYFIHKGLTNNVWEGFGIYAKYNHHNTCVDFPTIKEVCDKIHKAGGKAVLAHPGKVIYKDTIDEFIEEVKGIISFGIDGIECYYPAHSDEITEACLNICREEELFITTGSDCHGTFQDTTIGQTKIPISKIYLKLNK
ncbi:MAG: PHP domain-containing protein [Clostridiaceae bacterium]|nr:PHP domain-containing protein [Clostridiaceae bacterium]